MSIGSLARRFSNLSTSSTTGARLMNSNAADGPAQLEEEAGTWYYLVVDSSGIRPRRDTAYSKSSKCTEMGRIKEGSIVDICARRRAGWTQWLALSSGAGWVHDVSPKDYSVRMVEVEIVRGEWDFQVCSDRVSVLAMPSMAMVQKGSKNLPCLENNQVVKVSEKIRPISGKGSFLRLADGSGFVFDFMKGQQVMHRWHPEHVSTLPREASGRLGLEADSPSTPSRSEAQDSAFLGSSGGSSQFTPMQKKKKDSRAEAAWNLSAPEYGTWNYIVLDPKGVSLRAEPTDSEKAKTGVRLHQGNVVQACELRRGDTTTFLRLENPPGWAFDVQPGLTHQRKRLTPVEVEQGLWYYRVCSAKGVALRSRCSLEESAKYPRKGPSEGAVLAISRRVKVGNVTFGRLKDDDAWVPTCKDGKVLLEGPIEAQDRNNAHAKVKAGNGITLLDAPTKQRWAQTNRILVKGTPVRIQRSIQVEDEVWAYVSQHAGMEGWSFLFNFELEKVISSGIGTTSRCEPALLRKLVQAPNPVAAG